MDNFKIIYKILKRLERAMDEDEFDKKEIMHEALGISEARWAKIMEMLANEGYVQGVYIINIAGRMYPGIKIADIRITLKGLEYLEENSMMKKAGELVKGVIELMK